jgi:hypothetical protein
MNATHPLTGRRLSPQDRPMPDALGVVTGAFQDALGRVVFKYEDGHLFVVRLDRQDLVTEVYQPQVEVAP